MNDIHPLLAVNLGGGGGTIDFANMSSSGSNLAQNGVKFGIFVFVAILVLGIVTVLASRSGKSEMLNQIAVGVLVAVGIGAFVAWGTNAASAALVF
jgi:hypothetical protein